jgi:ribosome maturation factor RimP
MTAAEALLSGTVLYNMFLANEVEQNELFNQLNTLVGKADFDIVSLSDTTIRDELHVYIVISAKKHNTTINDCTDIYRMIYPRLTVLTGKRDIHLEVSSPGLNRTIKDVHEFSIFIGRNIKIMTDNEWIYGRLESADETSIVLQQDTERKDIPVHSIKKAKLVDWREE